MQNKICENQRDQREKLKKWSDKIFLTIFTITLRVKAKKNNAANKVLSDGY
jgi:hypothetical protein